MVRVVELLPTFWRGALQLVLVTQFVFMFNYFEVIKKEKVQSIVEGLSPVAGGASERALGSMVDSIG